MNRPLFLVAILFFFPISALADSCYEVSGAGTASVNGTYISTGEAVALTFNSCTGETIDKYTNGTTYIVPTNGGQTTRICPTSSPCATGGAYYSSGTDILCSPDSTYAGTWTFTNALGTAPAPTVVQVACPAPDFYADDYIPSVFALSFLQVGQMATPIALGIMGGITALMGLGYAIRKLRSYITGKKF